MGIEQNCQKTPPIWPYQDKRTCASMVRRHQRRSGPLCRFRAPSQPQELPMRLKTIRLVVMLALVILTAPLIAEAQQAKNVPRIGLLITNSRASESTSIEAFHRGLHELGYVEGQNISMEYRYADGNLEQLPQFAAELVRLN